MSLSVGIVGLPNVGKSTLFNALLKKQQALVANYPFATIEPNVGIVPVPDARLYELAKTVAAGRIYIEGNPRSKEVLVEQRLPPQVSATVKFVDIAGLVKGAHQGEGLGNQFLAHIREADVLAMVVRAFTDPEVVESGTQVLGDDLMTVKTELMMADLTTLEKQEKNAKAQKVLNTIKTGFDKNKTAREVLSGEELNEVRDLCLLTAKPFIYVVNVGENEMVTDYTQKLGVLPEDVVVISAKVESELAALSAGEQTEYLRTLGLSESALDRFISKAYERLGLLSFLTAGEIECRAWTLRRGDTALRASSVIHTDFAKKFIKADVISWQEFVRLGGWKRAREVGAVRSEGRDYVMKDGEVVEFKIGT